MKDTTIKTLKRTGYAGLLITFLILINRLENMPDFICIEPLTLIIIVGLFICINILIYFNMVVKKC